MRAIFALVVAAISATVASAQPQLVGRLLEVASSKDPQQRFALYVPKSYTSEKAWPVIFCFDPLARGREPVERLQAAAEKYGYLVAGSLNSRNGPWDANLAAIQAMVGEVDAHFHLDARRVYTAGLSGGARVATQLALSGMAKGVIACSAGFPQSDEGIPSQVPFVFFGTAGTEDFNCAELRRLDWALDDRHATHRVVVFEGSHEWASAELLTQAVEWLELQAMRAGTKARDEAFIKSELAARVAAIPAAPAGAVWRACKEIAADFDGLAHVGDIAKRAAQLATTRDVQAWRKADRDLVARETALAGELAQLAFDGSTALAKKKVGELRALAEATAESPERLMARRILAGQAMAARENVRGMIERGELNTAASLLEVSIAIRPEQARNYFDLARVRALDGDKPRALEALQQAAAHGFSDATRADEEPAFAKLKGEPVWREALAKIRANPPEPATRNRP